MKIFKLQEDMKMGEIKGRTFDLLTLGQLLLRLSPPDNDRLSRGDTFVKQVGGAELNVAVGASLLGLHTGVISNFRHMISAAL